MHHLKNTKIAVSILDSDFLDLEGEIKKIENLNVDCLHLDIMDGNFVPQITFGQPVIKLIRKKSDLFMDAHLMINNPDIALDSFIACGVDMITVHAESAAHLHRCLKKIKENKIKACVALNPSTPVCFIENILDIIDSVLIMSVNPGYGGQEFIGASIDKIKKCRNLLDSYCSEKRPGRFIDIYVDGGINRSTYKDVITAGASILILGSIFFKVEDPGKLIEEIRDYSSKLSIL